MTHETWERVGSGVRGLICSYLIYTLENLVQANVFGIKFSTLLCFPDVLHGQLNLITRVILLCHGQQIVWLFGPFVLGVNGCSHTSSLHLKQSSTVSVLVGVAFQGNSGSW